jgi:glycosyltransferase involved in cell wall biosynthesis
VNPCILIPLYDHGEPVAAVVEALAPLDLPCLIVDDGSGEATREALERIAKRHAFVQVVRRPRNGGKGAALKTGYRAARERGFSHVVQLDGDGQHDARDVPRFLAALRERPGALVLGTPVFDASVPRSRLYARQISRVLVWAACLSRVIADPLCGFRGIPLVPSLALLDRVATGDRMDFDPELAVRLVWEGLPVVRIPTRVVYRAGNASHFSLGRDYPLLAGLYTRLIAGGLRRAPTLRRRARSPGGVG